MVRGHWRGKADDAPLRQSPLSLWRLWRQALADRHARLRARRLHAAFCPSCGGTGWTFRDETKTRCQLCDHCQGSGREPA